MARSNKYTPLNFNGIFEKKLSGSNNPIANSTNSSARSFSNQSKTVLSNSRIHGNMLVLSRPSPRPITVPQNLESKDKVTSISSPPTPDLAAEPDAISLRPQGRTSSVPTPIASAPIASPVPFQVKSDRFVPPHRRPGFVAREEKPGPELVKRGAGGVKGKTELRGHPSGQIHGPASYQFETIDRRPKSGSGKPPNPMGG